jgi:hypothetical protein
MPTAYLLSKVQCKRLSQKFQRDVIKGGRTAFNTYKHFTAPIADLF